MNEPNKRDLKKLLSGRALYMAVAACLLVAGSIAYQTLETKKLLKNSLSFTGVSQTYMYYSGAEAPQEPLQLPTAAPRTQQATGVTEAVFDSVTPTVPETAPTEPATAAYTPVFCPPTPGGMGTDYSRGVPVYSDTMGDYRTHNGVDFKGEPGSPVSAVSDGTVIDVKQDVLYGITVTIAHEGGVVSAVSGLGETGLVKNGTAVKAGDVIGTVGELPLEKNEDAHVHLEIRRDGVLTDPLELLGLTGDGE